jgi:integrase
MGTHATPASRNMIPVEGHPGIWRRGNRYVVKYTDRGKPRKKYLRTLTEAKKFKATAAAGDARPTSARSFQSYAPEWVQTYRGRSRKGVSEETRESYAYALTAYAIPYFRTTRLDHIDAPRLRRFIGHLEKKGLAPGTIRRYYAPVRALLATAYEDGLINQQPNVRIVVRDNRPKKRNPKYLTAQQTARLLAEIPAKHADLVLLLARTAARISEALNAIYSGVGQDPDGGPMLSFPKSKTEAGLQPIPLTPDAARMLTRRRAETGATDDDLIFPNTAGNAYDRRAWTRRVFKPAARRAGVPWASPHMLRHGVATLMAEQGYEAHDIAKMLRHADGGALAQRTYMHPKVRSVDFLDDVLGG